jgi:hypothetical protein
LTHKKMSTTSQRYIFQRARVRTAEISVHQYQKAGSP